MRTKAFPTSQENREKLPWPSCPALPAMLRGSLGRLGSHRSRSLGSRSFAAPSPRELEIQKPVTGWWNDLVKLSYKWLGSSYFSQKADICNCGGDFGIKLPRPEVLKREGIEANSSEHRMMLYGGALYYHLATNISEKFKEAKPEMLRGKDVLEVACMRGGGARYLMEVCEPRRLLAVDHLREHIDSCKANFGEWPGLEYEVMDAHHLADELPAEAWRNYEERVHKVVRRTLFQDSFDFVLCIEACASFEKPELFVQGVASVLRRGGRLLLADAMERKTSIKLLDALEDNGFDVELSMDISRHVHAVGLCSVPKGMSYLHIVAKKE